MAIITAAGSLFDGGVIQDFLTEKDARFSHKVYQKSIKIQRVKSLRGNFLVKDLMTPLPP